MSLWGLRVGVLVALFALASGCTTEPPTPDVPADSSTPSASAPAYPTPPTPARQALSELRVEPRPSAVSEDYDRDAFGSRWKDIDGNGCDQRDDVLRRDVDTARPFETGSYGRCEHDMLAGTWHGPYTGKTLVFDDLKDQQQAQAIQIDHIVPLSEAWRSGARAWSDERRERYANTLSVLLAVDGPANTSKSDHDPAAWRPRQEYQCTYARRWIGIKHRWDLAVDQPEKDVLTEMLVSRCSAD